MKEDIYTTIAELVAVDYNGDECISLVEVKQALDDWRSNPSARELIDDLGLAEAVIQYRAAWDTTHADEYDLPSTPPDTRDWVISK